MTLNRPEILVVGRKTTTTTTTITSTTATGTILGVVLVVTKENSRIKEERKEFAHDMTRLTRDKLHITSRFDVRKN